MLATHLAYYVVRKPKARFKSRSTTTAAIGIFYCLDGRRAVVHVMYEIM